MEPEAPPVIPQAEFVQWASATALIEQALLRLGQARSQRVDHGCLGVIGCLGSGVAALLGLGLFSLGLGLPGMLLIMLGLAGAFRSIHAMTAQSQYLDEAHAILQRVAPLIRGDESINASARDLTNLHEQLVTHGPHIDIAVWRVLALCGSEESLRIARSIAASASDAGDSFFGRDPEVARTAAWAAERIEKRIELSRQASTMVRAADPPGADQLLRPAASSETDQDLLLRAETRTRD